MGNEYKGDYEKDLSIDKFTLHEELTVQAELFMKWSERFADAQRELDNRKENLDIVRAEIDKDIRDDYEEYGFDKKPTEAAIANLIVQEEKYRTAYSEFADAKKDVAILSAAKEAMSHKKKALEKLVDLWIAGYYSDKLKGNDKARDKKVEIDHEKFDEKMKRRKRKDGK